MKFYLFILGFAFSFTTLALSQTSYSINNVWKKPNHSFYFRNEDGSFLYKQTGNSQITYYFDSLLDKSTPVYGLPTKDLNLYGEGIFSPSSNYLTYCDPETFNLLSFAKDHKDRSFYFSIYSWASNVEAYSEIYQCRLSPDKKYLVNYSKDVDYKFNLRAYSYEKEFADPMDILSTDEVENIHYRFIGPNKVLVAFSRDGSGGESELVLKLFNLDTQTVEIEKTVHDFKFVFSTFKVVWNENLSDPTQPILLITTEERNFQGENEVIFKSFDQNLNLVWERKEVKTFSLVETGKILPPSSNNEFIILDDESDHFEILNWGNGQQIQKVSLPAGYTFEFKHFYPSGDHRYILIDASLFNSKGTVVLVYDRIQKVFLSSPVKPTVSANDIVDTVISFSKEENRQMDYAPYSYSQKSNSENFLFLRTYTENMSDGSTVTLTSLYYHDIPSGLSQPILENCRDISAVDIKERVVLSPLGNYLALNEYSDVDQAPFVSQCSKTVLNASFDGTALISLHGKEPVFIDKVLGRSSHEALKAVLFWKKDESGFFVQNEVEKEELDEEKSVETSLEYWQVKQNTIY